MIGRSRPGVSGLKRNVKAKEQAKKVGQEIEASQIEHMTKQLSVFKDNLEKFAIKYKEAINRNPQFRHQFQKMCTEVGVDPLASNKGFWAQLLGVGDFYYLLAVQIIEVCLATRAANGGLIVLEEMLARLKAKRGKYAQEISSDDIIASLKKVSSLGNGFQLLNIGNKQMIVSVPIELNVDHTIVLEQAQANAYVSASSLMKNLGWSKVRIDSVLDLLLQEGMAWIDLQAAEPLYWFPSLFQPPPNS